MSLEINRSDHEVSYSLSRNLDSNLGEEGPLRPRFTFYKDPCNWGTKTGFGGLKVEGRQ